MSCVAVTPPRTAFGSPTLPLQGRVGASECRTLSGSRLSDFAVTPPRRLAVTDLLKSWQAVEAFADEIVPAVRVWLLLAVAAAHDQMLGRTGHRHVQQPAMLVLVFVERRLARRRDSAHILIAAPRPDDACGLDLKERRLMRAFGRRGGVGEDHHRRFKALGAVYR